MKLLYLFSIFIFYSCRLSGFERYEIHHLDLVDIENYGYSIANRINNNGDIIGSVVLGGVNNGFQFLWNEKNGLIKLISKDTEIPQDINNSQIIIGEHINRDAINQQQLNFNSYIFDPSVGLISFSRSVSPFRPIAINDYGSIVGQNWSTTTLSPISNVVIQSYLNCRPPSTIQERTYSFKHLDSGFEDGSCFSGKFKDVYIVNSYPYSINNEGEIVGAISFKAYEMHCIYGRVGRKKNWQFGCLWDASTGKMSSLGINITPYDINDRSQIVGSLSIRQPILIENNEIKILKGLGWAEAINNNATIVGLSIDIENIGKAAIWENDDFEYLINLVDNPSGWKSLEIAYDINDVGQIVGSGNYKGKNTAFLLTPKK